MFTLKPKFWISATALVLLPIASGFASTVSLSVSDSVSGTVGSISDSVGKSSNGSSKVARLAQGDYKVTDIAVAEGRNNEMRIALQAPGDDRSRDMYLYLPANDYARVNLGVGQTVTAMQREYGVAFYQPQEKSPFVVVLADNWINDLHSNVVAM